MFWRMPALSASSPVESVLDKENFTLEELLDEEEIIQECKALNSRLINFLRDRVQVEQLLRYIVEDPPEDAESKRVFKCPFIACEIFTCEIDVILKTLVDDDELMGLLFSFLEPNHPHSPLLTGYFSKVVVCLMLRKTVPLMNYVQGHGDVFRQLVDLIGITSIMEVLIRLVGADDHFYSNFTDVMQWLADSNLLEMIVDKLNPSCPSEVQANAAETLCAITRNSPSALAAKLSSPSFIERIFCHALEESQSKSGLVHSLSICISLLDSKRSASSFYSMRSQHLYEQPIPVNPVTITAMIPKLGDLLTLLNTTSDETILPTTYGSLRPPLGKHRLKILEFIAVLLRIGNDLAEKELVILGAIQRILDLFFAYPFNNALHHHVESIVISCLESKNNTVVDHLFQDCNLVGKILKADGNSDLFGDENQPTLIAVGRQPPRSGNHGHITRISNKLVELGNGNSQIQTYLKENGDWVNWQTTVLQERNTVENVYRWACGRPTALHDRTRDSDDDDRDYDVTALANNLSQAFRYSIYENDDTEEVQGSLEREDEDAYFDDESAEVVISSLRLGDDQESNLFTNSNWFAFQDDMIGKEGLSTSTSEKMDDVNLNGAASGGNSSSDDEVVVGEDLLVGNTASGNTASGSSSSSPDAEDVNLHKENAGASSDVGSFQYEMADKNTPSGDRSLPGCKGGQDSSDAQVSGSDWNPFNDGGKAQVDLIMESVDAAPDPLCNGEVVVPPSTASPMDSSDCTVGSSTSNGPTVAPSLFEEDVEFVGVEMEGTEKAMEQALKEGIVGEAGPLKRNLLPKVVPEKKFEEDDGGEGLLEFNDMNYWKVDQDVAVVQE
ncbi:serine/threonine-protein phosphatase 6 regulatory subunit 3-like [Papaver somniferum]|uniref:serine/threonine-protein phosphatase 6 regulatory subunit 3-like n=1 Tax=Papaver somniferum TaxID=3469 RepID=UPI000E70140E|nr:serine/threonine-protein phosphatase 6 regulatory subunit 3-like [Papaver somniferum]XP_026413509.1 serine/threonine-protein phosphatase 6 regulatory subunit 3-like [Papaver somniferum]XP_026413510.1 serine/threonine-protein phosphatase 6 regulatory subunit 3-like [Papaver somniferum]XP_026413511.1 serine/threonine-protein phosphatase 6 regulatory subunit 3-like [Papaver somniferum]